MSIWLFRAGKNGEYEDKFLTENKVYLTWDDLDVDLSEYDSKEKLKKTLEKIYPDVKQNTIINWSSQIFAMSKRMKIDDWIIMPSKRTSTIHIGRIASDYKFCQTNDMPYKHVRDVEWFATDIPRSNFDQDILYSLGAFLTICQITRNNAEKRIKEMSRNGWKVPNLTALSGNGKSSDSFEDEETVDTNLEEAIYDTISKYIIRKFKGHHMEDLIEDILKAKGFTVYHSKPGADGGKDLLAAAGEMGFSSPKICIQVKSQDTPIDRTILDQLGGVMNNVGAEYGLLVSWSGFKESVMREEGKQFFKIRLWDSNDVIRELFDNYERLSASIRSDIPLKQIWVLNREEE